MNGQNCPKSREKAKRLLKHDVKDKKIGKLRKR